MKHLLLTTIAAVLLVGCGLVRNPEGGALRSAAIDGNIEAVKRHLAAGANVNAPNTYGWTALYFASSRGHKEIVELLIANGAYVNQMSDRGITPLDGAIDPSRGSKSQPHPPFTQPTLDRYPETADLLRKHGGKTREELEALIDAIKNGDIEAVKKFLPAGTDVNLKVWNNISRTPLHQAARSRRKEIAELLIAKGADVNAKTKRGETPLDEAIEHNHTETADLLRKHGGKTGEELEAEGK